MSSLLAIRASRSRSQGRSAASMMNDICGRISGGLLARYLPSSSFSRTYRDTLQSDLMVFDQSYTDWATRLRQGSLARRRLARLTNGSGSLPWPTARAEDSESCGNHPGSGGDSLTGATAAWHSPKVARGSWTRDKGKGPKRPTLEGQANLWSTPRAGDVHGTQSEETLEARKDRHGNGVRNLVHDTAHWSTPTVSTSKEGRAGPNRSSDLRNDAVNWSTPHAHDSATGRSPEALAQHRERTGAGARNLTEQASHLPAADYPTPTAAMYGSSQNGINRSRPSAGTPSLETMARSGMFPTPAARDSKDANSPEHSSKGKGHMGQLPNFIAHTTSDSFRRARPTPPDGHTCSHKCRRLNPRFVEYLMSWPIGWTACDAPVTGLTQYVRQWRSYLFGRSF